MLGNHLPLATLLSAFVILLSAVEAEGGHRRHQKGCRSYNNSSSTIRHSSRRYGSSRSGHYGSGGHHNAHHGSPYGPGHQGSGHGGWQHSW